MRKHLQVHLSMHLPVPVYHPFWDTHWNISIRKAVSMQLPLLYFFIRDFLCSVIRQERKTGVDSLASVLLNRCVWFCMLEPVISFSLHQRTDVSCWHIVLVLMVKPTVMANILSFTWESSCKGTTKIMLISINGVFF